MKLICVLLFLGAVKALHLHKNLVKLSVIFRHGDRLPVNVPFVQEAFPNVTFNAPPESLTPRGALRAKDLGTKLRKEYANFLKTYQQNEVVAISSEYQRCQDTLKNVSSTLYNQEIPYSYVPKTEDTLIATFDSVPGVMLPKNYEITNPDDLAFYEMISVYTGRKITNYRDGLFLQDLYKVMNEMGYGMPDWVAENWDEFNIQYLKFWKILGAQFARSGGGNLLHKIARDSAGVHGKETPKVNIYSGHDYNIVVLLTLLNNFNVAAINYCSYIAFEVYKPHIGPNYLEIYLDNNDDTKRVPLEIPGCGYQCPVNDFLMYAEKFYDDK